MTDNTIHSKVGASSMYRWSMCPGSVALCEKAPSKPSSDFAKEGTFAHDLAASLLDMYIGIKNAYFREHLADIPINMMDAIGVYIDYAKSCIEGYVTKVHVEHSFDMKKIYPGLFGTADLVIYYPNEQHLKVIDYKHGVGIPVEAENNLQLQYYALGALSTLGYKCKDVEMVVVQPRCPHPKGPIRKWKIEIREFISFREKLIKAVKATEEKNAELVPGDHCRFCNASSICPKMHDKALELAKLEFNPNDPNIDLVKLSHALNWLPRLENWIKEVRSTAYNISQRGTTIPGFKLVQKRSSRKWINNNEILKFLNLNGLRKSDCYNMKLKSPAQIEDMIKSKTYREKLRPYIQVIPGGTTLVPITDHRDEIINDPKNDFTVINETDIFH